MNQWNIRAELELEVRDRDKRCVYCQREFGKPEGGKGATATWEDIINDARIINRENIALCCAACNASKGAKSLADWLQTSYFQANGITAEGLAEVARRALPESLSLASRVGGRCIASPSSTSCQQTIPGRSLPAILDNL